LLPIQAFAVLSANSIIELNSLASASNINGGGFNPSNVNMLADLTTDANTANTNSPIVSSVSYNFVAGDVNAWLYVKSGTNWTPGWYQITSVTANKATLNAAIGAAIQTNATKGSPSPKYTTNTVAGCATVGTPTAGTFTIDYSQGTAAILTATDYTAVLSSTTMTSVTGGFTKAMIGNFYHQTTTGTGGFGVVGWYEIVNVTDTNTVTLDRTPNVTAASVACTGQTGGAMSLNSVLDDALFEIGVGTNGTGGMRFFVKNGSFTLGQAVSIAASGGSQAPIVVEGYNTLRGDTPTGTNRPTITQGANAFTAGSNWDFYNLIFTGTAATVFTLGGNGKLINCKSINTSTTADRDSVLMAADSMIFNSEIISYRGRGVNLSSVSSKVSGSYIHDSNKGLGSGFTTGRIILTNNIIADNVTHGLSMTAGYSNRVDVDNNTFYGAENKLGIGVSLATGVTDVSLLNNIIYGFATGVSHADTQSVGYDDYNDYNNNTNDVSAAGQWQKGANDVTTAPGFTSIAQLTGTTASVSGSVITDTNANFNTVTDNVDFIYLKSGTAGPTFGKYLITAHTSTTVTVDIAPGNSAVADHGWQITTGHNFAIGTNLKALGFPGAFQGGLTTGYMDIGGVQRQEAGGTTTDVFGMIQ
jgi:hypothetical protein